MKDSTSAKPARRLPGRDTWIDYARGIGIILVVYGHTARGLAHAGIPVNQSLYRAIDNAIYSFHMPLFFLLAGIFFLDSLEKRGVRGLILNKAEVLLYPYVLWSLLQGVIELLLNRWTNGHIGFQEILSLLWAPRAHFWFLYALFLFSVLGALIFQAARPRVYYLVLIAAALPIVCGLSYPRIPAASYVGSDFFFFALGIWFRELKQMYIRRCRHLLIPSTAGFVLAQYLRLQQENPYMITGLETLAIAVLSINFVVVVCMCLEVAAGRINALSALGAASMAIYLAHILAGSGVRIVLVKLLGVQSYPVNVVLGCAFGVLGPLLLFRLAPRLGLSFLYSLPRRRKRKPVQAETLDA
jgi:fucose 4-O-acetylase-like acetyltransferase